MNSGPLPPWFRLPPAPTLDPDLPVTILGAGLGGCWLAYELALRGVRSLLVDAGNGPASGASGNPAGIVKPAVTRTQTDSERFHTRALAHLLSRLGEDDLAESARFKACGVLQLVERAWPERPDLEWLDATAACERAGLALGFAPVKAPGALAFAAGGWLDPAALCRALVRCARPITRFGARVTGIEQLTCDEPPAAGWRLEFADGTSIISPALVLASGAALGATPWTDTLPVTATRGQLTRFAATAPLATVVSGRGWAIPDGATLVAGATYARGDDDTMLREADDAANRASLDALLPGLAASGAPLESRAGIRATTPDRLPIVGPVPDFTSAATRYADLARGAPPERYDPPEYVGGLCTLGGLSSRGIVTAPFSAALLADWLTGSAAPLETLTPLIGSLRFLLRDLGRRRATRSG